MIANRGRNRGRSCFFPFAQLTNPENKKTPYFFPRNGVLSSITPRLSPLTVLGWNFKFFKESRNLFQLIDKSTSFKRIVKEKYLKSGCCGVRFYRRVFYFSDVDGKTLSSSFFNLIFSDGFVVGGEVG